MVRSAPAVVALLVLPGFLESQEPPQTVPGTHEVVAGETLWVLAARFYGNPWQWRRIWEANQDRVLDPNLILPGQTLTIPDLRGAVTAVDVEAAPVPGPPPAVPDTSAAPSRTTASRRSR